jgi:fatty-acyl-CoA synthase
MTLKYPDLATMFGTPRSAARFTFLGYDDSERTATLPELLQEARGFVGVLTAAGVVPGDRVALLVSDHRDFVVAFIAVALIGAVACPLAPPGGLNGEEAAMRTRSVLEYLRPRVVIAPPTVPVEQQTVDPCARALARVKFANPDPARPAVIQCTSGSTGLPKGVVLSHRALLTNTHQIGQAAQLTEQDVGVTWLPMHHDMGLIGCFLAAVYWGLHLVMMPPGKFLRRPASWLRAISAHRATISPAPNFAYAYAADRIREDEIADLDLTSWRIAFCGSEAVSPASMHRFVERFAHYGLARDVVVPCYGLAECALIVTAAKLGEHLHLDRAPGLPETLASCGMPVEGTQLRILDSSGRAVPEGVIGRIAVASPSLMLGYFDHPELTAEVLRDGWLDTGDLGYLKDGHLYVSGREKDCLIFRGQCFAPSVFEWAAEEVEGVRSGGVAAVGLPDARLGTEALHLVCETRLKDEAAREQLRAQVKSRVVARTGIAPATVHLVRPGTLPKTTSGKIRRNEVRLSLHHKDSNGASNDEPATPATIREITAQELPR